MVASLQKSAPGLLPDFPVHIHLLGVVDFEDCLSLQRRLAYDAASRGDGRIVVLLCKHPPIITIGRAEACDIGLFGDPTIERLHARILQQGERYLIADAGSAIGTFLNDERVTAPTPLRPGDAIRIGKSTLRFWEKQKRG